MQARIARASYRAPFTTLPVNEDDVIEKVYGFQAHQKRRVSMLLERTSCKQRRLQAVCGSMPHDLTKTSQRLTVPLGVIGKTVQPPLNLRRRPETKDEPPFSGRESVTKRLHGRKNR